MVKCKLCGEYRAKLMGRTTITYDANFGKELNKKGIRYLFLVKGEEGDSNIIYAYTREPEEEIYLHVKLENGKFEIPKRAKKKLIDMLEFAGLEDEIIIIGVSDHFQIWQKEKIEKYAPKFSKKTEFVDEFNLFEEKKKEKLTTH